MATLIEPCPFCNSGKLHLSHHLLSHSVTCQSCKSSGPHRRSVEEAIMEWNHTSKLLHHPPQQGSRQVYGRLNELEDAVRNLASTLRHGERDRRELPAEEVECQ